MISRPNPARPRPGSGDPDRRGRRLLSVASMTRGTALNVKRRWINC